MRNPEECPYCRMRVFPWQDAGGGKICPTCRNTGRPVAPNPRTPPPWSPYGQAGPQTPWTNPSGGANAPGAIASMVMGLLAMIFTVYGVVFAILALVFGYRAKRAIIDTGGQWGGAPFAKTGIILGWVWVGVVGAMLVIFLFVALAIDDPEPDSAAQPKMESGRIQLGAGQTYLWGFYALGTEQEVTYSCQDLSGGNLTCALHSVYDSSEPHLDSRPAWSKSHGAPARGSALLARGEYALAVTCEAAPGCDVTFELTLRDTSET